MTEVTKEVAVAQMVKPKFLTLVGKPANQIAFKVIRDDNGVETMAAHIQRKRTQRSDSLITIEFEAGLSEDDVRALMTEYGISDYELVQDGDKFKAKKCGDEPTSTMRIDIGGGRFATILKPISNPASEVKRGISLASIEFASDYFPDKADIADWCKRNDIDFSESDMENVAQGTLIKRTEVSKDTETRKLSIDDGVQFIVARADETSIPDNFITVVSDTAYGCWGWGQLDFAAAMADKEFCEIGEEATYTLRSVIDRILFYSDLPVSVRKELVANAAAQFSEYIGSLLDALPTKVVIANRSIKENSMSGKQAVERQDAKTDDKVDDKKEQSSGTAEPAATSVSRDDVAAMIGEAMAGLSAQITELKSALAVSRTDEGGEQKPAEETKEAAPAATDTSADVLKEVARSIKDLADSVKVVSERVEAIEGATTVRSDGSDGKQVERKDVFKGMFGGGKATA